MSAQFFEHEHEPLPGLPQALPEGEKLLWQGAPCWRRLARRAFFVRGVALYFLALVVWKIAEGGATAETAAGALWLVAAGAAAIGLLSLYAWLIARTTVYTITSARIVMRFGVALPMTVNIPFRIIEGAAASTARDGSGDIALTLSGDNRVSYVALWPHARRWRFSRPEPALRALTDVRAVGRLLAKAATGHAPSVQASPEDTEQPAWNSPVTS